MAAFDVFFGAALGRGELSSAELDALKSEVASGGLTETQSVEDWECIRRSRGQMFTPDSWDVEPDEGLLVELHSLSRADLNGQRGFCSTWNATRERIGVELPSGAVAVRAANLRRAPPAEEVPRFMALLHTRRAQQHLSHARGGKLFKAKLGQDIESSDHVAQAERLLEAAEHADPASPVVHRTRCDLAVMRADYPSARRHATRAIANRFAELDMVQDSRMALASALHNCGNNADEAEVLRTVLRVDPENLRARFSRGMALRDKGCEDDALVEFMMALQLRPEDGNEMAATMRRESGIQLKSIYIKRVQKDADAYTDEACNAMLAAIDKVMALHERFPEASSVQSIYANEAYLHPAHFLTYRAMACCRLGRVAEADVDAARAVALAAELPADEIVRPFALCTHGQIKERMADEDGHNMELYAEAKRLYLEANAHGSEDAAVASSFGRVQAKMHPDLEITWKPVVYGREMCMSIAAKPKAGMRPVSRLLEPLPPTRRP